jgi:hypothetical protein
MHMFDEMAERMIENKRWFFEAIGNICISIYIYIMKYGTTLDIEDRV